ncbi:orexin/Hypocretin receptor type 1-like [Bacillus rossius redtenbacheri]|uniref:orexin/Hypocretin receptor type 1-like n=1 Tax=Bacillus rossius redtenbacheri TaxID=93214 RepID=UPI002FDD4862
MRGCPDLEAVLSRPRGGVRQELSVALARCQSDLEPGCRLAELQARGRRPLTLIGRWSCPGCHCERDHTRDFRDQGSVQTKHEVVTSFQGSKLPFFSHKQIQWDHPSENLQSHNSRDAPSLQSKPVSRGGRASRRLRAAAPLQPSARRSAVASRRAAMGRRNDSLGCSNDYCVSEDEYLAMVEEHVFPRRYEWALVAMHAAVFVVGLVGNALVCVAVFRNPSMRTVTNYFIVNLAVADFMVILFCLPPSVVWDITETWFMGTALCKVVLYFQTVSVAVSVLTLTFISVDRWYAICFPLRSRATTGRAKVAIFVIWLLALAFDVPELVVLRAQRKEGLPADTRLLTQCAPSWSGATDMAFHVVKTLVLYTVPLLFMAAAYCQIARVLWRSDIPGHKETASRLCRPAPHGLNSSRRSMLCRVANTTTQGQLQSRRKAAKMLVAVVVMFAVCFFPVHLLNILRYTVTIPQTDVSTAVSSLAHWLCYANSAVNPLIYNFMSGKFRKAFRRTFGLRWSQQRNQRHSLSPRGSACVCRHTATGDSMCTARSEAVPLHSVAVCCPD